MTDRPLTDAERRALAVLASNPAKIFCGSGVGFGMEAARRARGEPSRLRHNAAAARLGAVTALRLVDLKLARWSMCKWSGRYQFAITPAGKEFWAKSQEERPANAELTKSGDGVDKNRTGGCQ